MDQRQEELSVWVAEKLNLPSVSLNMVSGDASFRRYFRAQHEGQSWVIMDAPPEKEDSTSFVSIAQHWGSYNIAVPTIYHHDLNLGFLILSDMGDIQLFSRLSGVNGLLSNERGDMLYQKAMDVLIDIQSLKGDSDYLLPNYDSELLQREMSLFPDWLLVKKLNLVLSEKTRQLLDAVFQKMEQNALSQVQVPVHRDYHSRNLMVEQNGELGVLDFQDAVMGPITYDLVSLLRDCYVTWPEEKVSQWCETYWGTLNRKELIDIDYSVFKKQFDFMGIQRHLKAAGIFARLSIRDGKHGYLDDIPNTVDYIISVSEQYPELASFHQFLVTKVKPNLSMLNKQDSNSNRANHK